MFLQHPISDDPNDQLLLQIQGAVAEYERVVLGERFRRSKMQKARDGHYLGGRVPYGYHYVPHHDAVAGHLVVHEGEAELVRILYVWLTDESMTLLRRLAALRPNPLTSTLALAKASLRAITRRWLLLDAEIKQHEAHPKILTADRAPNLLEPHGMATGTAAEMLLLVEHNTERIHSEAAFAKLCGACPIPALSSKTNRHRLSRGGNQQANASFYRVVIVLIRAHQPMLDYVRRCTAEGKSKSEIIRCLKRYVACEIFGYLCAKSILTNRATASP